MEANASRSGVYLVSQCYCKGYFKLAILLQEQFGAARLMMYLHWPDHLSP